MLNPSPDNKILDWSLFKIVEDDNQKIIEERKENYADLQSEWENLQREINTEKSSSLIKSKVPKDTVFVYKNDLACLATEITQLKQTLPIVLNKSCQQSQNTVLDLQTEVLRLKEQNELLARECNDWRSKYSNALADVQTEKQECLKLRCEIQSLSQELSQQTEYCSSLGNACCTLLWRVSRSEDSVQAILSGTKVDEFFSLVSSTLQSYITAYREDWPQEGSDENQFILALCGIITNIAASAYGRDYLVTNKYSQQVLDTYVTVLQEAPAKKSARLKNLIMMCLYNTSINKKGIKFLTSKNGLVPLIGWLLQGEEDFELRLNSLRLLQSLMFEQTNYSIIHQVAEAIPDNLLAGMSKDTNDEIREIVLEMMADLRQLTGTK